MISGSIFWTLAAIIVSARETRHVEVHHRGVELVHVVLETNANESEREELLSIAHHESRFSFTALGDNGHAFGAWQLHGHWFGGHSGAELLASPDLQARLALRTIRHLKSVCGPKRLRWMGAFACGVCGGCPLKARELCAPIGCEGGL